MFKRSLRAIRASIRPFGYRPTLVSSNPMTLNSRPLYGSLHLNWFIGTVSYSYLPRQNQYYYGRPLPIFPFRRSI